MGVSQLPDIPLLYKPTPAEQAAAVRTVSRHALDPADEHELLDMLGLLAHEEEEDEPAEKHGTRYRYQLGCRCDDCRAANTARCGAQRARRKADPVAADRAGHGNAYTYTNYGCRCRPCTAANRERVAAYKAKRRAA